MSDWLKLVQCKYTPTNLFTIFDYSKVAYPVDSSFCLREVVVHGQKSSFIQIKHEYQQILAIHWAISSLVTLEKIKSVFHVCFYSTTLEESIHKINVSMEAKQLEARTKYWEGMLMICFTDPTLNSHELIFFDCQIKKVVARGFTEGEVSDMSIGPNQSLSLSFPDKIIAYKNDVVTEDKAVGRIYKQIEVDLTVNVKRHFWIEDELLVWGENEVSVVIKNKICQQFKDFTRLHTVVALTCGFLACDGCVIKIYKKKNIKYDLLCEFIDQNLIECQNMCLSPQEDIIAYYSEASNSIVYSTSISQEIEEAKFNDNVVKLAINLRSKKISHSKSFDYSVFSSRQPWFAAANGNKVHLMSSNNYEEFCSFEIANEGNSDFFDSNAKIRHVAIHPNRPILAVALKKMIRIYYVTFNEVKVLKQLNCSMCGHIIYNQSGSLMTAVVSGKGGAKIYIFKVNEFKSDYSLVETLTIAKKPVCLMWNTFDSKLFCFFSAGYYEWTLESKFKLRREVTLDIQGQIEGALITKQDSIAIWGANKIYLLENERIEKQHEIKGLSLKRVYFQGECYFFVFNEGLVGKSKTLDFDITSSRLCQFNTNNENFQVQLQEDGNFILLSKQLNLRFYEYVSDAHYHTFTDVVGIDRKKIYGIMSKHKEYEQQIKEIRQQLTNVVAEVKAKSDLEQKRKQEEYREELKDHIERERKVKQEKTKLEEIMERNIEIKEREAMNQVKQLERLYERKIALTTNKLLTEKEIGFRDKIIGEKKLKELESTHSENIEEIRKQFSDHLTRNLLNKDEAQKNLNETKKEYETRLLELEQQNEIILKEIQEKNDVKVLNLKKIISTWENKFSDCTSQKDNIEKQLNSQIINSQMIRERISFVETKKMEAELRCEHLSSEIGKVEKVLEERNRKLVFYEKRIQDLQKSNEILKYRVLEVKQQNDPSEEEIIKLKQNLTELEQQYDKILKHAHEEQQKIMVIKKQKAKLKQENEQMVQKSKKTTKRYEELIDKLREITKWPIQDIRKELLGLLDSYSKIQKSNSILPHRADSPLGELNRIRDHLQVCLDQAVTSGKKNDHQRKNQILKKNHENSELILQINRMKKEIRRLEDEGKQKDLKINRLVRGDTPPVAMSVKQQKVSTTQAHSKEFTKTKSRETFYENSLFKSGTQWNQKRLRTEEGSSRKKSSHSMMRDRVHNASLSIRPHAQEIEEYKRIVEQKDLFIQKLIAKIQKSS